MQASNGNKNNGLMLVGMGASAGGVDALLRFFENVPADSGLAYAVVLHTTPDHVSRLAEVIQTRSTIPVSQLTDTARIDANHVYCIPPDKEVLISDGLINLVERDNGNGHNAPIDLFFRTLAGAYKEKAIAVVLSGAGADGSVGLGQVREEGGVSIAQDPAQAQHSAMPKSAIETGWVDFILPVEAMPDKLVALRQNAERIKLPPLEVSKKQEGDEDPLRELLALLRARTRHDFTSYKRSTLLRRIERRMQVTESEDLPAYLAHVRQHPDELLALLRDLLISVTNFFRDREAFASLETEIVPLLFDGKGGGDQVRVWVSGCATGEEAYSLGMLLCEYADRMQNPPAIQIFATDIDDDALAHARHAVYLRAIETDVSHERLKRFFVREGQYYRVKRELRELVLFAPHNILRDPPFSKLDLVSCRNLLIYINRTMQEKILQIFHFALRSKGFLFLGSSESVEGLSELFAPIDKKHRIFKRQRDGNPNFKPPPALPVSGAWLPRITGAAQRPEVGNGTDAFSFGELHYRMLEAYAPPSALVNSDFDVVHLSDNAGKFMRMAGGEPSRNLLKMVHPNLRLELRSVLLMASQDGKTAASRVLVELEGSPCNVNLTARPVISPFQERGFILVLFDESEPAADESASQQTEAVSATASGAGGLEQIVRQLEGEVERTRDQLRATIEEYETSTEELKASNEELQAMNEELRSASEELETGKEELQSVNEELTTLNLELRDRIEEISRANNDLQNLMASTMIGTLFLDRSLRLKRYTPSALEIFNIIPGDLGRPLAHITHKLDYEGLAGDAERVLRDLQTVKREIRTRDGRTYVAHLLPYRTSDEKIGGVVLTFTDIEERRLAEESSRESRSRLEAVADLVPDLLWSNDPTGRADWFNLGWLEYTGQTLESASAFGWLQAIDPSDRKTTLKRYRRALETGSNLNMEIRLKGGNGEYRWFLLKARPVRNDNGDIERWFGAATDIHERRQAEEELRISEERLRLVVETTEDYAIMIMDQNGIFTDWNKGAERMFGYSAAEAIGQSSGLIFTEGDRANGEPDKELNTAASTGRASDERWHKKKDGSLLFVSGVMVALKGGGQRGFAKIARDLTVQRNAQNELQAAWEELDQRVQERTTELAAANESMREEVSERRRAEQDRLELLRRIVSTQEDERRRISRELHDQLGQSLTALRLKLEGLSGEAGKRSKLKDRILDLVEIARRLDSDVDFLAWELRPSALDDLGLVVALSNYAHEWSRHFNVELNFHSAGLSEARFSMLVNTNLYRIAQEALNNIAKYAAASSVDLLLEHRDDHVVLIIEDNGRGFDTAAVTNSAENRGLGLLGMRERAALVEGSIEIESTPGKGTTVFVRVPFKSGSNTLSIEEGDLR